jgi:hypothetical protein
MTVFVRVLDSAVDEKADVLRQAIARLRGTSEGSAPGRRVVFECAATAFAAVPRSPFAYWVTDATRETFVRLPAFEQPHRRAMVGVATGDDARYLRIWWEVSAVGSASRWKLFAKGGAYSPAYADVHLCIDWLKDGIPIEISFVGGRVRKPDFLRPGLTWPLRTQIGLGMRALPAGCIFGHKGPAAFVDGDSVGSLLALLAITISAPFRALVGLQMAFGSYEAGVIQRTPVPRLAPADIAALAQLAKRAWSLKRSLDARSETSHAFVVPSIASKIDCNAVEQELETIQKQIDDEAFRLYGMGADDRADIDSPTAAAATTAGDANESDDGGDEGTDDDVTLGPGQVCSWLVGVAFGRFDPRLATSERAIPPEPEPFDPLPSRSAGMYPEGEEPADRPDILVDDKGHPDDLAVRAQSISERVKVDVPENLRGWLARDFFPLHIKMYSKSRRKAPIYWQLATPSASYSVWLYIHAFSKDTLFRVQNDYVAPKLAHEERRLQALTSELRDGATTAQRKALAAQEALVEELRGFLEEVKRVTPLWKPNLDDGVVINFAPLWRLVPQNKTWQKELKSIWAALCEGTYDWAHLAMHLWSERVIPTCAKDRSLAIAHGLEDVFWVEGSDSKWTARKAPTRSIDELMRERTSPAVRAALKSLLEASTAMGSAKERKGKAR